jgi:bilirubin oxidase
MNILNYSIPLNSIEIWTLDNQSPIAHPFHIHDVQFYITELNGLAPPPNMAGRKDVVLVPAMQTVKFIAKFETFCDSAAPYMYHCHMLPHEDDGMMGQFVVTCPTNVGLNEFDENNDGVVLFPNPTRDKFTISQKSGEPFSDIYVFDYTGKIILSKNKLHENQLEIHLENLPAGIYFVEIISGEKIVHKKINLIK